MAQWDTEYLSQSYNYKLGKLSDTDSSARTIKITEEIILEFTANQVELYKNGFSVYSTECPGAAFEPKTLERFINTAILQAYNGDSAKLRAFVSLYGDLIVAGIKELIGVDLNCINVSNLDRSSYRHEII